MAKKAKAKKIVRKAPAKAAKPAKPAAKKADTITVKAVVGNVMIIRAGTTEKIMLKPGTQVSANDIIVTDKSSTVQLSVGGSDVNMSAGSQLSFKAEGDKMGVVLTQGSAQISNALGSVTLTQATAGATAAKTVISVDQAPSQPVVVDAATDIVVPPQPPAPKPAPVIADDDQDDDEDTGDGETVDQVIPIPEPNEIPVVEASPSAI